MTLTSAILRALIASPAVAAWAILPRCTLLDRAVLKVCRAVYP